MSSISISEAAGLTGKSTKTLYRMVSQGKLSVSQGENGIKTVEISELIRVFGENLRRSEKGETASMSQRETVNETDETPNIAALETRIDVLRAEIAARDALLEAKNEHIASLKDALRLLERPRPVPAPEVTPVSVPKSEVAPVPARKPAEPVRRRWWQAR